MKDYYGLLGGAPDATTEIITTAYRKKAAQFTPGRNPGTDTWRQQQGGADDLATFQDFSPKAQRVDTFGGRSGGRWIEDADVIVAGGRGLGGPEGFSHCEELAAALGGAVAATRAVVDAGWYPYSAQVGQTGKTVSPKL